MSHDNVMFKNAILEYHLPVMFSVILKEQKINMLWINMKSTLFDYFSDIVIKFEIIKKVT